jgi:tetratricopeptide (TPR) repeat protein
MEINNKKPLYTDKVKPDSKTKDASFYYMKGITAYEGGNHEEAESNFSKAIDTENNNAIAYFNRGTFYLNEKKYKPAIEDFMKAIRLRRKFAEAYYNLACAYVHILSFREGLANLKTAVAFEKQFGKLAIADLDFRSIKNMKEFKEITLVYAAYDNG